MFDLDRFVRLARVTWAENRRLWAWYFGAIVMLHFVLVLIQLAGGEGYKYLQEESQAGTFAFGLYVTAPIFAARWFQGLARPGSALLLLMRPASTFEKWLLAVLAVAVVYPIVFHLVFYVCDVPAWLIAKVQLDRHVATLSLGETSYVVEEWAKKGQLFTLTSMKGGEVLTLVLAVWTLQAFAMLGALVFRAMPFLKTLLAGFVVLLLCVLAASMLDGDPGVFFDYWTEDVFRSPAQRWLLPLVWFAVPALLWLATWVALREREVA